MAKKLSDVMAELPPERRAKIEARAQELIAENMTLQDIREARKLTQESSIVRSRPKTTVQIVQQPL